MDEDLLNRKADEYAQAFNKNVYLTQEMTETTKRIEQLHLQMGKIRNANLQANEISNI